MSYLQNTLQHDDNYINRRRGCRLPHDSYLKDKVKLASLSGECKTIVKGEGNDHTIVGK